jgi:hypothetical protein
MWALCCWLRRLLTLWGVLDEDGVPAWSTAEPHLVFVPLGVRHRVAVVTSRSRVVGKAAVHGIVSAEHAVVRRDNAAFLALHSPCDLASVALECNQNKKPVKRYLGRVIWEKKQQRP